MSLMSVLFAVLAFARGALAQPAPDSGTSPPEWLKAVESDLAKVAVKPEASANELLDTIAVIQRNQDVLKAEGQKVSSEIAGLESVVQLTTRTVDLTTTWAATADCKQRAQQTDQLVYRLTELNELFEGEAFKAVNLDRFTDFQKLKNLKKTALECAAGGGDKCCSTDNSIEGTLIGTVQNWKSTLATRQKRLADINTKAREAAISYKEAHASVIDGLRHFDRAASALRVLPQLFTAFFAFLLLLILITAWKKNVEQQWISSGQLTQLLTVSLVVIAVLGLGFAQVLQEETLGTLLGAVAAYVLSGRATGNGQGNGSNSNSNSGEKPSA